ncbi:MAG: lytic murein transglycosylase B [Gammaproteobacteria bacterium CG11_big_fil_rev_8_21_14_0_20_46_22]|nr:MAG: lytic murein transglycosylase B [Gammaproteobacteria bacterium CG12_big_fil_rev_8_21_14_0_65_46_12]PIR10928.1 MAG: lytic murein transglycosylase B [Gammaproteobacteria bacterium CG11_big_fil_rev_8_21_14_0_20_46_22]
MLQKLKQLITCFIGLSMATALFASTQQETDKQHFINYMVRHYHVSRPMVTRAIEQAQYRASVLQKMRQPFESKPWYEYQKALISPTRVTQGVAFWKKNIDTLQFMFNQFHVPSKVIVGILGIETRYGMNQGSYKVINALVTLSFYYPARTKFFQTQLAEFILYCEKNHIKTDSVLGSYAGAIGQAQFMPTSISAYAVSAKKTGDIDLSHNVGDVIASVSNFLSKQGWRPDQAIATLARFKDTKALAYVKKHDAHKRLSLLAWEKLGVYPKVPLHMKDKAIKARLMAMPLKKGTEYWLTFYNFDVIKHYNPSNNYALAVVLLGTAIQDQLLKEGYIKT